MRDHRQFERYQAREPLYLRATGFNFSALGRVEDFGFGGVSYTYVSNSGGAHPREVEVEIFTEGRSIPLSGVPCQLAYSHDERLGLFKSELARRCGLRFGQLSKTQEEVLWAYILWHLMHRA